MTTTNSNSGAQFPVLAGTEGTREYLSLLVTVLGILALRRDTASGVYRLRVEPTNANAAKKLAKVLTRATGWKQPGDSGQNRFSKTCSLSDDSSLAELTETAATALFLAGGEGAVNKDAPEALSKLLTESHGATPPADDATVKHPAEEHAALVASVKGANSRWGLVALRARA